MSFKTWRPFVSIAALTALLIMLALSQAQEARAASVPQSPNGTLLSDVLNPDGTLQLPQREYGSLDPTGFSLVSGPNEPPRFAPDARAIPGNENPSTTPALGSMDATVWALAFDSSGNLYAGGAFTSAGACTLGCNRIAKWNGTTWSALDAGMNGYVHSLAFDSGGNLYAAGTFTDVIACQGVWE